MSREKALRRFYCPADALEIEAREENQTPRLRGYAAVFNQTVDLGPFTESIAPGAFRESIERQDDVRALFNHDPSHVLGRTRNKTLSLSEDSHGLTVEIQPPDTQLGRDITAMIERGDISQMSIGFYIEEEEIKREKDTKTHFIITKVRLFDVSPVTFPAYEQTEIEVQRQLRDRLSQIQEIENEQAQAEAELRARELEIERLK